MIPPQKILAASAFWTNSRRPAPETAASRFLGKRSRFSASAFLLFRRVRAHALPPCLHPGRTQTAPSANSVALRWKPPRRVSGKARPFQRVCVFASRPRPVLPIQPRPVCAFHELCCSTAFQMEQSRNYAGLYSSALGANLFMFSFGQSCKRIVPARCTANRTASHCKPFLCVPLMPSSRLSHFQPSQFPV